MRITLLLALALAACTAPTDDSEDSGPVDTDDTDVRPPEPVCVPPAAPVDTSTPDQIVGTGSAASCTEENLQVAVSAGGTVRFDCGGPATIDITRAIELPLDRDVILDGQGQITLDGGRDQGRSTRLLVFDSPDYRATTTTVTLQHLTLQNAAAPASDYVPPDPENPECAHGYRDGQGGAVYVRDGVLHVFDCVFRDNRAATPGPDTGGGGIYAVGSLEVLVVDSVFEGNEGANGGAVGLLQSDGVFVNTRMSGNAATGTGANFGGATGCPEFNHAEQGGAGGNGGALAVDGSSVERLSLCGVVLEGNAAGALGTVFRTPNTHRETTTIDRCTFADNQAVGGYDPELEAAYFGAAITGGA